MTGESGYIEYIVTFRKPDGDRLTWSRYAPNRRQLIADMKRVLDREYGDGWDLESVKVDLSNYRALGLALAAWDDSTFEALTLALVRLMRSAGIPGPARAQILEGFDRLHGQGLADLPEDPGGALIEALKTIYRATAYTWNPDGRTAYVAGLAGAALEAAGIDPAAVIAGVTPATVHNPKPEEGEP